MMTMFNQINSRVVEATEWNVFKTICSNPIFWFIWAAEMAIQHVMLWWAGSTDTGAVILAMAPLPFGALVASAMIGAFSIVIHIVQTKFPLTHFIKLDEKIGIDDPASLEKVNGFISNMKDNVLKKTKTQLMNDEDDDYRRYEEIPED